MPKSKFPAVKEPAVKPKPKPSGTDEPADTTSEDVRRAIQTAVLTLMRWEGHSHFRDIRGNTLRSFSEGMANECLEIVKATPGDPDQYDGYLIPIPEVALCLLSASLLVLARDPRGLILPENMKSFLTQLSRGV